MQSLFMEEAPYTSRPRLKVWAFVAAVMVGIFALSIVVTIVGMHLVNKPACETVAEVTGQATYWDWQTGCIFLDGTPINVG